MSQVLRMSNVWPKFGISSA